MLLEKHQNVCEFRDDDDNDDDDDEEEEDEKQQSRRCKVKSSSPPCKHTSWGTKLPHVKRI
jgi:hypothetical protein